MTNTFKLKLIAPDGVKYEQEAEEITLPTAQGQIGVLRNHMPLISLLKPGEIIIKNGKEERSLVTDGGVVEIADNVVTILADTAEEAGDLDEMKIIEAKKAAEQRLAEAKDEVEFTDAAAALEKQLSKINILTKRKRKYQK